MKSIAPMILGLFAVVLGIFNISGNISTIHWYNRTRVTEEDRIPYGKAVGTGTIIIGASIVISGILALTFNNELFWCLTIPGAVTGLAFIIYGQFKYNKGIF